MIAVDIPKMFSLILFVLFSVFCVESSPLALHSTKWTKCVLGFRFWDPFGKFSNKEEKETAKEIVVSALREWSQASDGRLSFVDVDTLPQSAFIRRLPVDIEIAFASKAHGCVESFDGIGGLLAHSAYPPNGLLHFDADEQWTEKMLRFTSLHEIGHILGLQHSEAATSIMRPIFYPNKNQSAFISLDDQNAIRRHYHHCF